MKKYDNENENNRPTQSQIIKEIRKWGIIITILLIIPILIALYPYFMLMIGP